MVGGVFDFAVVLFDDAGDVFDGAAEEFFAEVDAVQAFEVERFMKGVFEGGGVVAGDHHVDVEGERDGGVAEFEDAVDRLQATGHADLKDAFAEAAEVGDDVDVAGFGELGHGDGAL